MDKTYRTQILYTLSLVYLGFSYFLLGEIALSNPLGMAYQTVSHPIDMLLPTHPAAATVYLSYYIILLSPLFFFKDKNNIKKLIKALFITSTISHFFFVFYPVYGPSRIPLDAGTIPFKLMNSIYNVDTPLNCFPSLHVVHSVVIAYFALNEQKLNQSIKYLLCFLALMMGPSAVSIKQHYFADVFSAYFVCFICIFTMTKYKDQLSWDSLKQLTDKIFE